MAVAYPVWILVSFAGIPLVLLSIRLWRFLENNFHVCQHYRVPKFDDNRQENPLYRRVAAYISSLSSLEDSDYANIISSASKRKNDRFSLQIDDSRTVRDSFLGAPLFWSKNSNESFVLRVRRRDRRRILRPYLNHVECTAEEIHNRRDLRFFSRSGDRQWRSHPFSHPATLDSLAVDVDLKNSVRADLETFLKSRSYYHRLGRVWKRSYLLHGPSGTEKSSFAAAIARFLRYDLYDLDLSSGFNGCDFRDLLLQTNTQSVIIFENFDRHLASVNISGILNLTEGLFSCFGEERVMVFTMSGSNDCMDAAALRADVHIHLPLCDFSSFRIMAGSYLGLKDHKLFHRMEEIVDDGVNLSQAEIGEILISNRSSTARALKAIISASQARKKVESVTSLEEQPESGSERGGGTLKEIKKLYGLIKLRSGSRKEGGSASAVSGRQI